MALRSFFAYSSSNLMVTSSSNGSIVGNPVINNSDTPNGTVFSFGAGGGRTVTLDDRDGGGNRNRFNDDDPNDHRITDGNGLVANDARVEAESKIYLRALDGNGNPTGPTITITVFSQGGVTQDVWGFSTDTPLVDGVSYVKTGGSNTGTTPYSDFITCFAAGTMIDTPDGPIRVEEIETGQMISTLTGAKPVRWVSTAHVLGTGAFAPVRFAPGSFGNTRPLLVSQQHRMLMTGADIELLFGSSEVLVAAKHLCDLPGVSLAPTGHIGYTHFMFDSHQIVHANGVLSESFFFATQGLNTLEQGARDELLALFPSIAEGQTAFGQSAAPTLNRAEARVLTSRLLQRTARQAS